MRTSASVFLPTRNVVARWPKRPRRKRNGEFQLSATRTPLILRSEIRRATEHPQPTHGAASVDASSQLPQMAQDNTRTNDELDTDVTAPPPPPSVTDEPSARVFLERVASPPAAPVRRSERAREEPLPRRPQTNAVQRRHLAFLVQKFSAAVAEGRRIFGHEGVDLQDAAPSIQRAAELVTGTVQDKEKHAEAKDAAASTSDASIGASSQQPPSQPALNGTPLAATTERSEAPTAGTTHPAKAPQSEVRTILSSSMHCRC